MSFVSPCFRRWWDFLDWQSQSGLAAVTQQANPITLTRIYNIHVYSEILKWHPNRHVLLVIIATRRTRNNKHARFIVVILVTGASVLRCKKKCRRSLSGICPPGRSWYSWCSSTSQENDAHLHLQMARGTWCGNNNNNSISPPVGEMRRQAVTRERLDISQATRKGHITCGLGSQLIFQSTADQWLSAQQGELHQAADTGHRREIFLYVTNFFCAPH